MASEKIKAAALKEPLFGDQYFQVSRLHLDSQNPRHEPLKSDAKVIAQLCSEELVSELAQDIATRGALSPLDTLSVVADASPHR